MNERVNGQDVIPMSLLPKSRQGHVVGFQDELCQIPRASVNTCVGIAGNLGRGYEHQEFSFYQRRKALSNMLGADTGLFPLALP